MFSYNGISFIPVILSLFLISIQGTNIKKRQEKIFTASLDGLKYIRTRPVILSAVLATLAFGTFAINYDVIIPVFSDQVLHKGAQGYGFLLSAFGFGSLVSALFVATRVRNNPSRKLLYASGLMVSVFMVAAYFIHSYQLAIVDVAIIGFFNMSFMTLVNSTIQLNVDDNFRGRVMSVYTLAFAGTTPIGNLFAGGIIQKYGAGAGFLVCGGMTGVLLVVLMLWMFKKDVQKARVMPEHSA